MLGPLVNTATINRKPMDVCGINQKSLPHTTRSAMNVHTVVRVGYVATATIALDGWKSSTPHNNVIINKKIWKDVDWKAIGVGIYGGYATIWFGEHLDNDGSPKVASE